MNYYNDILKFIKIIRESFPNSVEVYTSGSCVRFALILKKVYPKGEIYWNQSHAVFKYENHFYDITGDVSGEGYNTKLEDWGIMHIHSALQLRYKEPEKL